LSQWFLLLPQFALCHLLHPLYTSKGATSSAWQAKHAYAMITDALACELPHSSKRPQDAEVESVHKDKEPLSTGGALEGLRVLEPARYLSGPVAGMLLADLGAEVIHIEEPHSGDGLRQYGFTVGDQSSRFLWVGRNKRSITLNLRSAQGVELFKELVKRGDVVIVNFAPGTMDRLGLGYAVLEQVNPRIIVASISGFGDCGPDRDRVGFDLVGQAAGGLLYMTGHPDGPPARAGTAMADILAGLLALYGIMACLYCRDRTGRGQFIDVSLMDSAFFTLGYQFLEHVNFGLEGKRSGNRYPGAGVTDLFEAKDGYIALTAPNDRMWQDLVKVMGREELLEDPRLATNLDRAQHADLVCGVIQEWCRGKTVKEVDDALRRAQVPCCPLYSFDDLVEHPSLLEREMVITREGTVFGTLRMPGVPIKLSATPGSIGTMAPALGEHNEEVYCGLLGLGKGQLESLRGEGVI